MRIPFNRLVDFGTDVLAARGVPRERARAVSEIIVTSEAFRQSTHGLAQLQVLTGEIGHTIDPAAEPKVVADLGAVTLIDGNRAMGLLAVIAARQLAMDKARRLGIGFVSVRNTRWIGALGIHLIDIARAGFVAQMWAQYSGGKDCAPPGGLDGRLGTNPIALAYPTAGEPVVADFSTSTISYQSVKEMVAAGRRSGVPRFLDKTGRPSSDPGVLKDGGTLMLAGGDADGHKAYALSLFNEILAAVGGGSASNPNAPPHQSFSLMVLDPAALGGRDHVIAEATRLSAHVKSSRVRPGFDPIRLPGDRGLAALADAKENGVPLDEGKVAMLRKIAREYDLAPPV